MLYTVKNIYANAKAKIRSSDGESHFFPFKRAVSQGETLTPKLYTLHTNDLFDLMRNSLEF